MRLFNTLSLMITYQCNVACRHCGPYCSPLEKDWVTIQEMKDLAFQAGELGAFNVVLTGGEPTLLKDKLNEFFHFVKNDTRIKSIRMVTNAKWASSYDLAYKKLQRWQESGLDEINFSCGEYHQEWIPVEYVVNAFNAARDLEYTSVVLAGEFIKTEKSKFPISYFEEKIGEKLVNTNSRSPFSDRTVAMNIGSCMAYGRGKKHISKDEMVYIDEENIPSLCQEVNSTITIHPNGDTTACCGVMVREKSFLTVGNWRETKLQEIVNSAKQDIILNWIKYLGLRDMKKWLIKKDPTLNFPEKFVSICDLCAHIMYNEKCQKILMKHAHERQADIVANKIAQQGTIYAPEFQRSNRLLNFKGQVPR